MRSIITWARNPENRPPIYLLISVVGAVLTTLTGSIWWLAVAIGMVCLHLVFRDTMNVFQWFPWWGKFKYRIYWYTRNNADTNSKALWLGYIYTDIFGANREVVQYFYGRGPQVRIGRYSFQFGVGEITEENPWARPLEVSVDDIKKGTDGVWEQDDATASR